MLTDDQVAYIRSEIGDSEPPTDADLFTAYERLGIITAVAIEVIRKRIATIASGSAVSFSIAGEYSQSKAENIKALQEILKRLRLEGLEGDPDYVGAGTAVIGSVRRSFPR